MKRVYAPLSWMCVKLLAFLAKYPACEPTGSGFSNLAGAQRKSSATSSDCAGYFSYSKFYYSNYAILFHQSNRDLIFLRK